jgi:hypothetical protein
MGKNPRKIKRIVRYKEENPTLTLEQIGERFKTSRQYIHKVLKNQNIPTAIRVKKKKVGYCLECNNAVYKEYHYIKRLCSKKCHFKYFNIKIICDYCKIPFYRKRSALIQRSIYGYKHSFCTVQCYYRAQRDGIT